MSNVIEFPHQVEQRYCAYRHENVPTTLKRSKNGSENHVCLDAADCKRVELCHAIQMVVGKIKLTYVKCCGICQRRNYCKHLRPIRSTKEAPFIKSKERDNPVREKGGQGDYTKF